jgi:hypothetical protein
VVTTVYSLPAGYLGTCPFVQIRPPVALRRRDAEVGAEDWLVSAKP